MTGSTLSRQEWTACRVVLLALGAAVLWPASASAGPGAVYTQTNTAPVNEVVVYDRAGDGTISESERVPTGGSGSTSNPPFGFPIIDSQGPVELTRNGRLLFVVNAGSDTISSFRVHPHGITLVDQESSGGRLPVSLDSHHRLLYVLNELSGTISGFTYDSKGELTPIPGSTRSLATPGPDGVAGQIGFDEHGDVLTVTERLTNLIDTFVVNRDGTTGPAIPNPSNAPTPFGFAYDNVGHLVVANAGPLDTFAGSASSYSVDDAGTVTSIDNEPSEGLATCWVVITNNGKYAFMTNTLSNSISRFRIGNHGDLTLLGTTDTTPGGFPSDEDLSRNSKFLYVLIPVFNGTAAVIDSYRVRSNGSLTKIATTPANLPAGTSGLAAD